MIFTHKIHRQLSTLFVLFCFEMHQTTVFKTPGCNVYVQEKRCSVFSILIVSTYFVIVAKLLESGVSPDLGNEDGLTALHQVCFGRIHKHE